MSKSVIIHQLSLPVEISDEIALDVKSIFESKNGVKVRSFLLEETDNKKERILCIKLQSPSIRKTQVEAMNVFRYLSVLEVGVNLLAKKEIESFFVDMDSTSPLLNINKKDGSKETFSYERIFSL